jgi:hypothetical protein
MPRHSRNGDDYRGRAEAEFSAKMLCRRGAGQGPSKSFDVDPAPAGRDHQAVFPCHPVTLEEGPIVVHLEHSGGGRSSRRTMHDAIHRTSRQGER